jgi:hypothetical protein
MAVTETSLTLPTSTTAASEPSSPSKSAVLPSANAANTAAPVTPAVPAVDTTSSAPKQAPAVFGLTMHFDSDTQRMILEARDPSSGYVIFQMPAKYIVKQFSSGSAFGSTRGASVNRNF